MAEINTKELGNFYEKQARKFLEKQDYEIIEQNWQCGRIGEIDFVVLDKNRFKKEFLVFVEVKYRYESLRAAKQAVNYKKQLQLKKLASLYLKSKKLPEGKTNISYDVIAISPNEIEHIKNIFNI